MKAFIKDVAGEKIHMHLSRVKGRKFDHKNWLLFKEDVGDVRGCNLAGSNWHLRNTGINISAALQWR